MDINSIKETLEAKRDIVENDKESTNELLVDDLVTYLRYNKRLDKGTKRRISEDIDWEIQYDSEDSSKKLMIKVYGHGAEISEDEILRVNNIALEKGYQICVLTDGERLIITKPNAKLQGSFEINLFNENETTEEILKALSKNAKSDNIIDYNYYKHLLTIEVIQNTIKTLNEDFTNKVMNTLDCPDIEEFRRLISSIISTIYEDNGDTVDKSELDKINEELKLAQDELKATKLSLESKSKEVDQISLQISLKTAEGQEKDSLIASKDDEIAKKNEELENKNKELAQKQLELDDKIAELSKLNESNDSDENENNQRITELEQQVLDYKAEIEKISTELNDIKSKESDNSSQGDNTATDEELKNAKAECESLHNQIVELTKKCEDLQVVNEKNIKAIADIASEESMQKIIESDNMVEIATKLASKLNNINTEDLINNPNSVSEIDEEVKRLKDYIYNIELGLSNAEERYRRLNQENEKLEADKEVAENEVDDLRKKLAESEEECQKALTEAGTLRDSNENLKKENAQLSKFLEASRNKNEELLNKVNGDGESTSDEQLIAGYREQIEKLSEQLADAQEDAKDSKEKLDEALTKLNELSDNKLKKVDELLACIEDSNELKRTYVGVVNDELYQTESLNSFIGQSLQKLYELKNFEASSYLFNGDIFRLVTDAVRRDLILNSKPYDIDLTDITEDEALNKLRIVFSKFSDIPFGCKKIGNINIQDEHPSETYDETSEYVENSEYTEDGEYIEDIYDDSIVGQNDFDSEGYDEEPLEYGTTDGEQEFNNDYNEQEDNLLYVALLDQVNDLTMNNEIEISTIRYILTSSRTFIVTQDGEDISLDKLLSKSIDALLAVAVSNKMSNKLEEFKQLDLTEISGYFSPISEGNINNTKIFGNKYTVSNVQSIQDIVDILLNISNSIQLDNSGTWIYLDGITESDNIINNYGAYESTVYITGNSVYSAPETFNREQVVISGYITDNISITKNSMIAHNDIVNRLLAVKSDRIAVAIREEDDIAKVFKAIIDKADEDGIRVNTDAVGKAINSEYKLITENPDEVDQENSYTIDTNAGTYYVPKLLPYQYIYGLIKLQSVLHDNKKVAVKALANTDAINFYDTEFISCEPSLTLAVQEFVNFVKDKISK